MSEPTTEQRPVTTTDLPPITPTAGPVPPPTTPKAPPRFGRARKDDKPPAPRVEKPAPTTKSGPALKRALQDMYTSIGVMTMMMDPVCGQAVVNGAEPCADALVKVAEENPAVKKALQRLVTTSVWGGVIAAHTPIIMAIASHHIMPKAAAAGMEVPVNVSELFPETPDHVRDLGPSGGSAGKFCPKCKAAVVMGVRHTCQ